MAKEITTEHLAEMVQRGFAETAKKEEMDMRFNKVDERFNKIDEKLERIEDFVLKQHDAEIRELKMRVKALEDLFAMPMRK